VFVQFRKPYYEADIIETMKSRLMKWANGGVKIWCKIMDGKHCK